ncbi:hypothetical protein L1987_45623 [Smallanthus sonchifolius]|uniref:Uncharacterized protein n=1 Tax=Smallanthus sonchifolius TaxID=185202 RepID=A0ACB9FXH2_9ASTR|nr:hypothetical protein L1987_45623 [Smallanthus sonchifolius]
MAHQYILNISLPQCHGDHGTRYPHLSQLAVDHFKNRCPKLNNDHGARAHAFTIGVNEAHDDLSGNTDMLLINKQFVFVLFETSDSREREGGNSLGFGVCVCA